MFNGVYPFYRATPVIDFSGTGETKVKPIKKSVLLKQDLVILKGGACERCGQLYPAQVYDFHHKNPLEKAFQLNAKELANRPWGEVIKEADKTALVCATCHRLIHITKEKEWFDEAYWHILEMAYPEKAVADYRRSKDIHVKGKKPDHYNRGNHGWRSSKNKSEGNGKHLYLYG